MVSTAIPASEFDKEVKVLPSAPLNQCLYLKSPASTTAELRFTSKGTRYRQARMNYHPYARITQSARPELVASLHQPEGRLHFVLVLIALASGLTLVTETRFITSNLAF